MAKNFLFIFFIALMINKTNNKCINLNDIWICGVICTIAKASCSSQNCKECEVCEDDWFCKSCKTNYEMAGDKKSCHKIEVNWSKNMPSKLSWL